MGNSLSVWRRVLRPWPVAVASSVLLFGLLASLAWHWAEQQAYRQETQRLQVLQGELVRRNTLFFEQLHGHLQELASLQLSRCDAPCPPAVAFAAAQPAVCQGRGCTSGG